MSKLIPFDHTNHKKLWNDLASGKIKDKHHWDGFKPEDHIFSYCFACKFCVDNNFTKSSEYAPSGFVVDCSKCPLEWPEGKCRSADATSFLYDKYLQNDENKTYRKNFGEQIRDLPIRKGVEII